MSTDIWSSGRFWFRGALSASDIAHFQDAFRNMGRGKRFSVAALHLGRTGLASRLQELWPQHRAVRAIGFDKASNSNWALSWHQDRVVPVAERAECPGFTKWTRKAGIWHCQPPEQVLRSMIFLRVFLDPVAPDDGSMEFAIGSHQQGIVSKADAPNVAKACPREFEQAAAGDILALPMLTLHRSGLSRTGKARRVLRLDLASAELPSPLAWAS